MKRPTWILLVLALVTGFAFTGSAAVLLNDTWTDGSRTQQNLPEESAWFASSTASLTAAPGSMTGAVPDASSRTWWTYFTDDPANPPRLEIGQTLKVTVEFTVSGVNVNNTSRGLRIGLYDVSGGTRQTLDSGSPSGTDVRGYMLNMNFSETFGINNPLQIMERTTVSSADWISATGPYTSMGSGGGPSGSAGFSANVPYALEFSVARTSAGVQVTTTFSDNNGWSITHSVSDTSDFTDAFDAFAFRPNNALQAAATFQFTRFKVEIVGSATPVPPTITLQPQSQAATAGDDVTFTVAATGSTPLSYQWFKNTTQLTGRTDAVLTLNNVQQSDAGDYTVTVSNTHGFETSQPATLTVNAPSAPSIVTHPQNQTVTEGQNATFVVVADGTEPLSYQWYFNGTTLLTEGTSSVLSINNAQSTEAGAYHAVVSNSLGSAPSNPATLTVNPLSPDVTVIIDDTWQDGSRAEMNLPDESPWYSSTTSSLQARQGSMLGTNITSARVWLTHFTDNPSVPVELAVGQMIRATLVFTPTNVATFGGGTQRGLRFGLFNFADGGTRLVSDTFGSSEGNGVNVTGYMLNQNFYTFFSLDEPMEIRARSGLSSINLLGTTDTYTTLSAGPAGYQDAAGFSTDTQYTLEFSVARYASSVVVKTRIFGGTLDISHSATDDSFRYHRFDTFAIRPNNRTQSADHFHFTRFKVETLPAPPDSVPPFSITAAERISADELRITWEASAGRNYQVQARDAVDQGTWAAVGSLTATGASASLTVSGLSSGTQRFFRVVNID